MILGLAILGLAVLSDVESKSCRPKEATGRKREVEKTLRQVTEEILDQMQKAGWYFGDSREARHDRPTAWHVNCGWCEEWVLLARKRVGGEMADVDAELGTEEEYVHCVLLLDVLYYDSQTPHGVDDLHKLDVVRRVSLEEFLRRTER